MSDAKFSGTIFLEEATFDGITFKNDLKFNNSNFIMLLALQTQHLKKYIFSEAGTKTGEDKGFQRLSR